MNLGLSTLVIRCQPEQQTVDQDADDEPERGTGPEHGKGIERHWAAPLGAVEVYAALH